METDAQQSASWNIFSVFILLLNLVQHTLLEISRVFLFLYTLKSSIDLIFFMRELKGVKRAMSHFWK